MNKSDLVAKMADAMDVSKNVAEKGFASVITGITDSLVKKESVTLVGFGTFSVKERDARIGRNPKTGESLTIPKRTIPHFKAGKETSSTGPGAGKPGTWF